MFFVCTPFSCIISKSVGVPLVTSSVFCFRVAAGTAAAAPDPRLRFPPPIGGRLPPRLGPTGGRSQEAVARGLHARASLRAGAPLQPATLPQRSRKGRSRRCPQAHRDPGRCRRRRTFVCRRWIGTIRWKFVYTTEVQIVGENLFQKL